MSGIPISLRVFQFVLIHTVKGFSVVHKTEVVLKLTSNYNGDLLYHVLGDLSDPGTESMSLTSNLFCRGDSLPLAPPGKPTTLK